MVWNPNIGQKPLVWQRVLTEDLEPEPPVLLGRANTLTCRF
jgi:hypothetical protein